MLKAQFEPAVDQEDSETLQVKKMKARTPMLRVAFYGGAPVNRNRIAARVAGLRPAASKVEDLRQRAKKAKNEKRRQSLMNQALATQRRTDARLVSRAAVERARKALERSTWSNAQRVLERTEFKK
jgi:hypothetical protein